MEDAIRHAGLPRRKAVVIRNGVSLPADIATASHATPARGDRRESHRLQGPRHRAQGFRAGPSLSPKLDARLELAGAGPEEGARCARRARELGIDADVDFLGSVTDVPALLATARSWCCRQCRRACRTQCSRA